MRCTLVAVIALSALALVAARCPSACSGHGSCGVDDVCTCWKNWQGFDCAERTCEFGIAWATDSSFDPHYYAECSAKGICDRETGECVCFDGYTGAACKRSVCPNDCSGHGKCRLIQDLPNANSPVAYTLWDTDKIQGCVCDGGYTGADCSQRLCPRGDDPMTTCGETTTNANQIQTIQVLGSPNVRLAGVAALANANVLPAGYAYSGELAIKFTDDTNELWVTNRISDVFGSSSAAATAVAQALQSLPNFRIPSVTVTASDAQGSARQFQVTFSDARNSGNPSTLAFDSPLGCVVAGCHPLYKQPMLVRINGAIGAGAAAVTTQSTIDPLQTWHVTADSQLQTNLMPKASQGLRSFAALVTVYPSTVTFTANTPSTLPAHAYKVDWDVKQRFLSSAPTGAEQYAVLVTGTTVTAGATFTLTFRGITTAPISWDVASVTNNQGPIRVALETLAMQLGGDGTGTANGAVTVSCKAGPNPTTSLAYASNGAGTGLCTITLNFLAAPVASALTGTSLTWGDNSVGAALFVGKIAGSTTTSGSTVVATLDGVASGTFACSATPSTAQTTLNTAFGTWSTTAPLARQALIFCASAAANAAFDIIYTSNAGGRLVLSGAGLGTAYPATATFPTSTLVSTSTVGFTAAANSGSADTVTLSFGGNPVTTGSITLGSANDATNTATVQTAIDAATSWGGKGAFQAAVTTTATSLSIVITAIASFTTGAVTMTQPIATGSAFGALTLTTSTTTTATFGTSSYRTQTLTLAGTSTGTITLSYNGGTATPLTLSGTIGTDATNIAAKLTSLGFGSFSGSSTAAGVATIAYSDPAISSITATTSQGSVVVATTIEEVRINDGGFVFDTINVIEKRPLPETRYAAGTGSAFYGTLQSGATPDTGTGYSRVPIGYGVYIAIPQAYYNQQWLGNSKPFSVVINFDIATATSTITQAANAAHEDYECSGRGHCDVTTGTCACFEGYYGDHCGMQTILV